MVEVLILTEPEGLIDYRDRLSRSRDVFDGIRFRYAADVQEATDQIAEVEVLVCAPDRFTRELFRSARNLRWIHSLAHGVEQLLIPEVVESSVRITSSKGVYTIPVAEHTIAMILALSRGLPQFVQMKQDRRWIQWIDLAEIHSKVLGVIGLGDIGTAVARRAKCFGMRVVGVKKAVRCKPDCVDALWGADEKGKVLRRADYVVLSVPLTRATLGMFGYQAFAQMKDSAFLVNVSRGGIVQEEALMTALREGRIAGAALDVFEAHPVPRESPLWDVDNLLISPYVAWNSPEAMQRSVDLFAENLGRYMTGQQPLRNLVEVQKGY